MRLFVFIVSLLLFLGCSSTVSKEGLKNLNGYWEIEKVVFPDGNIKEYKVNTSVDYIQLEDTIGFRKKVQPKLNGTYETSDDAENFTILEGKDDYLIRYKTELSEWSEKLVALNSDSFSVINEEGVRYDYRKFEPMVIME